MNEIFTFYRAVDSMKGSWDGYGCFSINREDFLAFVTDAPSGASIHTPELIKEFWRTFSGNPESAGFPQIELADALNRLQNDLQARGRRENILYQATISVARKIGSKLYYCCVGDSVFQIYRGGKLYRLSEGEVWDGALIATNEQTTQERQKTREMQLIGSNASFIQASEVRNLEMKDGDLLLFYTDGIEDLLPPDKFLRMLDSSTEQFRSQMETIFSQDKVKDDATLLVVPVHVSPPFHAQNEIASLRTQLERTQKDIHHLRDQIVQLAATNARLDKIENGVNRLSNDLRRLNQLQRSEIRPTISTGTGVSARKKTSRVPWLIALLCLLAGTAAGAFLFRTKEVPPQPKIEHRPVLKRQVAPPEIPSAADCSYVIQKGDSLEKIATSKSIPIDRLLELNPDQKKDQPLIIGKTITVCETP